MSDEFSAADYIPRVESNKYEYNILEEDNQ